LLVPFAAAWWLGTESLEQSLKQQVEAKLRLAGHEWATVAMDGRDAIVRGEAESQEAKDMALETVAGQYGLRRVASAIEIVPPIVLNAPTVNSIATNDPGLPLTGTWPEGVAKFLTVAIGDRRYELGRHPELTSAKGTWSLKMKTPPADGTHDVKVEVGDGRKARAADATVGEFILDTTPPQAPSVASATGLPLTGTWDEEQARSLKVTIAGKTYVLGTDGALSSDGKGGWKLALTDSFAAGSYDVAVETSDELGNVSKDASTGELAIAPDLAPPASPTIMPVAGGSSPTEIAGTWPEGDAVFLAITVHGRSYIFGSDPTLTSDGKGNWRLALADELPKGVHDVAVTISDASGNRSSDLTRGEIQVKSAPAAPPEPAAQPQTVEAPAQLSTEAQSAATQPAPEQQAAPAQQPAAAEQPAVASAEPAPAASSQSAATAGQQPAAPQPAAATMPGAPEPAASPPPAQETKVAALAEVPFEAETDVTVNRKCQQGINAAMSGRYIFFLSDGDTIAPESIDLLKKVASAAQKCPRSRIEIGGHTDATGSPTHNLELSQRRAASVLETLVGSGVERARLSAVGYGEKQPTATNKTPEGRAINRRIEFVVAQ
jgi:outer membrane protein OmpA-like peptidoglycan-associated protein